MRRLSPNNLSPKRNIKQHSSLKKQVCKKEWEKGGHYSKEKIILYGT
jgi:hypothetical protein